jgi:hypothetical protein
MFVGCRSFLLLSFLILNGFVIDFLVSICFFIFWNFFIMVWDNISYAHWSLMRLVDKVFGWIIFWWCWSHVFLRFYIGLFFFFNLIGLKKFIFSGFVLVDRSPIYNVNFRLGVGKLVQILPCLCCSFRHDIFLRLRSGFILHVVPDYLYVSFIFMFSLLVCYPRYFKLVYPIGLDVYRYIDLI